MRAKFRQAGGRETACYIMSYTLVLNPPISIKFRLNLAPRLFWIFIFISIISLLVLYIFQVNSLTGETYLLKNQERKLTEIKKEKEILEINFSRANSLANMENYFQNHDFEKANRIKYIQILDTPIVTK